jgi:DNA (cytosine-5)-methyltransferase 1
MGETFTFIDLFAGIGGMRLAFQKAGGKCVFSSEWDRFSCKTYEANFGDHPSGDITRIRSFEVPQHDVLVAGFPCQPFSIAGVTKHKALGNGHGFSHTTQGTLFFDVARIIRDSRPRAFLLENVKNLVSHDSGRTFALIKKTLKEELGYTIYPNIVDASARVPQHRERIYIVGFREPVPFEFPRFEETKRKNLVELLDDPVPDKYLLTEHLWGYLQGYAEKHRAKGNGFGFGLIGDPQAVTRTLSARYYKDGSEILIPTLKGRPRRLTPRECARLMGFPDSFKIPVSDTQAYRQFGNSVVVPIVTEIAVRIADKLAQRQTQDSYASKRAKATGANGTGGNGSYVYPTNGHHNGHSNGQVRLLEKAATLAKYRSSRVPVAKNKRSVSSAPGGDDVTTNTSRPSRTRVRQSRRALSHPG